MTFLLRLVAISILAITSGCGFVSVTTAERHLQTFLATIPATGVAEVRQISITPLWIETAYAKNITAHPDGRVHVETARLTLFAWLVFAHVGIKNFQQPPAKPVAGKPEPPLLLREPQRERAVYPRDPLTTK